MKKIIAAEWLSLDGFMAGPNGETDWFGWDEEIEQYAKESQSKSDTLLFGRTTYDLMVSYWPTPAASAENKIITDFMNNTPKIVFSKTLEKVEWKNSTLVNQIDPEEIKKIKQKEGKYIMIFGSGSIVSQLMKLELIDEYEIFVNPIVLGNGKPLFQNVEERSKLKLLNAKTFKSGVVLLNFQAGKK